MWIKINRKYVNYSESFQTTCLEANFIADSFKKIMRENEKFEPNNNSHRLYP